MKTQKQRSATTERYNSQGLLVYREWGREWQKYDYDVVGNQIYYENSQGYWSKSEYDADGNETCYENSEGLKIGKPHTSTDSVIDNVQSM